VVFFGKLADGWELAEQRYHEEKDDLFAGRVPNRRNKDGLRLGELCNQWLHQKRTLMTSGELTMRTWDDYRGTANRVATFFGKDRLVEDLGPTDFEKLRADFGSTWGPVRVGNHITWTIALFNYAYDSDLIDKPIRFGPTFKKPSKKTLRRIKKAGGPRMFERDELLRIINAADPCMKAMVLLAANGGLGNHDVGMLTFDALEIDSGWLDYPRPKTGVDRLIPLWPETVQAIKEWLDVRPEPKKEEDKDLVFLTKQRFGWCRNGWFLEKENSPAEVRGISNPIAGAFRILLDNLGINGKRNFYAIRHGFETIAGDTGDQVAVDSIMGHADRSMAGLYRERIERNRLRRVVEHVRQWLFGPKRGK
jgi:integrase